MRNGEAARSITFALARGMRADAAALPQLCERAAAARSACPEPSRIGFGRFTLDVRGYEMASGQTEVSYAIDAYLGQPQRRGDVASVVLIGRLLGADLISTLLTPTLGTSFPATTNTVGRLVRKTSGRYGIELQFGALPVRPAVAAPATAMPSRFELTLTAVRRVRQDFIRRIEVPTPTGYEVRKIHDHRLVGKYLLRTPQSCNGSWPSEVQVGLTGRVERSASRIPCTKAQLQAE